MTEFLLNLDEIDYVKRQNRVASNVELAKISRVSRNTWTTAINSRRPTTQVLGALADLGARPEKVLVAATRPVALG